MLNDRLWAVLRLLNGATKKELHSYTGTVMKEQDGLHLLPALECLRSSKLKASHIKKLTNLCFLFIAGKTTNARSARGFYRFAKFLRHGKKCLLVIASVFKLAVRCSLQTAKIPLADSTFHCLGWTFIC